eukprot:scaffold110300_cov69-Phaeocystis_antarctica.AAC.1
MTAVPVSPSLPNALRSWSQTCLFCNFISVAYVLLPTGNQSAISFVAYSWAESSFDFAAAAAAAAAAGSSGSVLLLFRLSLLSLPVDFLPPEPGVADLDRLGRLGHLAVLAVLADLAVLAAQAALTTSAGLGIRRDGSACFLRLRLLASHEIDRRRARLVGVVLHPRLLQHQFRAGAR